MSIPAPSTRLQVSHGSLHSITAICFDGTTMHELAQLPIQDSWDGCVVDVTMPPKAVIPEEGLIHDYFFLFLEPTEGEGRAGSVCNTISLKTQEVQSRVYHPISLIQLDYLPEGPVREMLSAYAVLQERLGDLGLISGLKNSTGSKRRAQQDGGRRTSAGLPVDGKAPKGGRQAVWRRGKTDSLAFRNGGRRTAQPAGA